MHFLNEIQQVALAVGETPEEKHGFKGHQLTPEVHRARRGGQLTAQATR